MKFEDALIQLADEYGIFGTEVPYTFAVEYLNDKNQIDFAYFTRTHKTYGSVKDFRKAVISVFGDTEFTFEEPTEVVTKEEFLNEYDFGKYPKVIKWVEHFAKTKGKMLRKQDLFTWVVETSAPSNHNYSARELNEVA